MRQSLPDLALELSMDGIVLHQRTAPGQWAELGASRIDAPDLGANLRAMRGMADTARGQNFRTQIWLPDEQVSAHNLLLTGETQKEREQSARDALAAITPHRGEDFTIVLGAPSVSGYTPVAAVLLQTLKEARVFAEDNGFRPVGFSSRQAPPGFDFTPAFTEPPDFGPLKRRLSFVAGLAFALVIGGIGFRIADPYDIWLIPPQEVSAPSAMPDASPTNSLLDLALLSPKTPARPAMQPGKMIAPEGTPEARPMSAPPSGKSGTQVAAPVLSAPRAPLQLAATPLSPPQPRLPTGGPRALYASVVDQIPARKSPRLQQRFKNPVAPAFADPTRVRVSSSGEANPPTSTPGKILSPGTPVSRSLPNPTVTRAFPLDNLEAIVSAAEILSRMDDQQRMAANRAEPAARLAGTVASRNGARLPQFPSPAILTSPAGQPAATLPAIGQMALLRPLRRPVARPADLQTEGEFENPVAEPEIQAPPLALIVPPDAIDQPDQTAAKDTPPSPPLTEVAWLSSPLSDDMGPKPVRPADETQASAPPAAAQQLPAPTPGDRIAALGDPAEPINSAEAELEADPSFDAAPSQPQTEDRPSGEVPADLAVEQPQEPVETAPEDPPNPFAKFADKPPRPRPASVQQQAIKKNDELPTEYALLNSSPPKERPATLELKAASARRAAGARVASPANPESSAIAEAQDEPEATGIEFVSIPTSATVQRAATVEDVIDASKISLMGVYGTAAKRRALIRLPSGRFVRVETGDKFSGYQVASIGASSVKLLKSGRTQTLKMPK